MLVRDFFPEEWPLPVREGSDDEEHKRVLKKTGFWGERGAGCVIMARSSGRFLLAHRSKDVQEPYTWGTWGGAIDSDEDPLAAAKREVEEETGYAGPAEIHPLYVFRKPEFSYFNFLAIVDDEFTPSLDSENQGFRWCEFGDWPKPLHFGMKGILNDPESVQKMQEAVRGKIRESRNDASGLLQSLVAQDQSIRQDYQRFVQKIGGDWDAGAKAWAEQHGTPEDDIFGDRARLGRFIEASASFDFRRFGAQDWHNYWLLAQHCDFDRAFQKRALGIIEKGIGAESEEYRYLADRISCGETGTQKYGTQDICDCD